MSTTTYARIGAVFFVLWGLLHIVGGGAILAAAAGGAEAGYAIYQNSAGPFPPVAGAILSYFAFQLVWLGALVAAIGATLNWRNSALGLALNTALAGLTDLGLVIFLAVPGYVSWPEAAIGIVLFLVAAVAGGIGCRPVAAKAAR